MKRKTINTVISKKVNEWVNSITDGELRDDVPEGIVVTGGCIASMLLKEPVNDFDIYFRTADLAKRVARYYVDKFAEANPNESKPTVLQDGDKGRVSIFVSSAGIATDSSKQHADQSGEFDVVDSPQDEETEAYKPIFLSSNAITLSSKVQLIVRFTGEPEEIHDNYDFVHCLNYWTRETGVVFKLEALEALLSKELRYVGSKYPLCSIFRSKKFIQRGWTMNAGQYVKMAMQLNGMDLSDPDVLEEQLVGVDVTYFRQLINALKENEGDLNAEYVIEVVERLFD